MEWNLNGKYASPNRPKRKWYTTQYYGNTFSHSRIFYNCTYSFLKCAIN